jgi:hypothetical protein
MTIRKALLSGALLVSSTMPVMGEEPPYPGDTSVYETPPPLEQRQIDDPAYWRSQKEAVQRKDVSGRDLWDRAKYCEQQEGRVNRYAEASMAWLTDHDILFAPTKGFVPHGVVMSESEKIRMFAEVAFRDMRYAKNNGAVKSKCDEISQFAIVRMLALMSKYPSDHAAEDGRTLSGNSCINSARPENCDFPGRNLQGVYFIPNP